MPALTVLPNCVSLLAFPCPTLDFDMFLRFADKFIDGF